MSENTYENVTEKSASKMEIPGKMAIAKADEWIHPIQPYGELDAVKEICRRIQLLDRGKNPMNKAEALMLAQNAITMDLNPFNGEIWGWVQTYGNVRKLTIMPGRRGIQRKADEKAEELGMIYWEKYRQITNPEERELKAIPGGALASEAKIYDDLSMAAYTANLKVFIEAGYSKDEIADLIGDPPYKTGLGILTVEEMKNLDKSKDNKMPHLERVQKRAYTEGLKKKFHLPFGSASTGSTYEEYVKEPTYIDVKYEDVQEGMTEEEKEDEAEVTEDYLKKRRAPGFWAEGVCEAIVDAGHATNIFNAASILAWSNFRKSVNPVDAVNFAGIYREVQRSGLMGDAQQFATWAVSIFFDHTTLYELKKNNPYNEKLDLPKEEDLESEVNA
jgi:hypothetical protein